MSKQFIFNRAIIPLYPVLSQTAIASVFPSCANDYKRGYNEPVDRGDIKRIYRKGRVALPVSKLINYRSLYHEMGGRIEKRDAASCNAPSRSYNDNTFALCMS